MPHSLRRYSNALFSGWSYLASSVTGKPYIAGMPSAPSIELTNCCNLACPECFTGSGMMNREKGYMDRVLFRKIIDEVRPYAVNLNLYFQGEPMLHPSFFEFVEYADGIKTVISTNGHFINNANAEFLAGSSLSRIIISMDGIDNETYQSYRKNGDLERVKEGIRLLAAKVKETRSKLVVEIQTLVTKINEHQITEIKQFALNNGVRLRLKSMQIVDGNYNDWLPDNESYSRYSRTNGEFSLKSRRPDMCKRLWFNPVITWDGKVLPCCFDKNGDYIMGDLKEESLMEIWNGPRFRVFRKSIISGKHSTHICLNCTNGLKGVKINH